jgi:hypothetical protein
VLLVALHNLLLQPVNLLIHELALSCSYLANTTPMPGLQTGKRESAAYIEPGTSFDRAARTLKNVSMRSITNCLLCLRWHRDILILPYQLQDGTVYHSD